MRLKEKVVLVTGSGIGEGMARRFALEGAHVVVHGTDRAPAEGLTKEIRSWGGQADYVIGWLQDPPVPAQLIAETVQKCGRLDCLVNNAAAIIRSNLETTDLQTFDYTIAVNLRAPFLLIQAALPQFRSQGGGKVINIGSINAYCGERNQFPVLDLSRRPSDGQSA